MFKVLKLVRKERESQGIFGRLFIPDTGEILAATLEHAFRDYSGNYYPILLRGSYICVRGIHTLVKKDAQGNIIEKKEIETFEVTGVAGHSGVLFHRGNYNSDSTGCILVGCERVGNMITESEKAFDAFMKALEGQNEFILQVDV